MKPAKSGLGNKNIKNNYKSCHDRLYIAAMAKAHEELATPRFETAKSNLKLQPNIGKPTLNKDNIKQKLWPKANMHKG
ncbi:hypothetical protein CXB51_014362 [Gossypium anomalum]|uniref:Uncharacterized protein n=1 Tax=Gossypium anomalum TaxID=47600 RepID=A0A8J6D4S8_9ROSI|nr:hypothetical protein CXB51_014362 [Gossypium anomalum]